MKFKKVVHGRHEGKLVLRDKIIDGIVYIAVSELPYVSLYSSSPFNKKAGNEDIKIIFNNKNTVSVQVAIKVHYTQGVSDIAFKVQEAIRHSIESMTEYSVSNVNVFVKGVTFEKLDVLPDGSVAPKVSESKVVVNGK